MPGGGDKGGTNVWTAWLSGALSAALFDRLTLGHTVSGADVAVEVRFLSMVAGQPRARGPDRDAGIGGYFGQRHLMVAMRRATSVQFRFSVMTIFPSARGPLNGRLCA